MKILVVEDEQKVALFIQKGLQENGFTVDVAFDGAMGERFARDNNYDAIVLDVNLPLLNGFELCKMIRSYNKFVPIIMLTAFSSIENKLNGFDLGADDYLIKPFEFRELLARIKSLIGRSKESNKSTTVLTVANLKMELETRSVFRDNKKIDLTAKEFALLEFFIRSKGRTITRVEIAEKVWDINFDTGTNIVDVYVNFLRKKIDKEFSPKLIHTKIGMGYIFKEGDE